MANDDGRLFHIWGRLSSINVRKAVWAAQEVGAAIQRTDAGGHFGLVQRPEFLRMNPNAMVPVLQDGPVTLWESNVIVRYLADQYPEAGLMPDSTAARRRVGQVPVEGVAKLMEEDKKIQFVDVRRQAEFAGGHAVGTVNIPLDKLPREFDQLDPKASTYVICQSGYRSSVATSILENAGFAEVYNVIGGTKAWTDANLPVDETAPACQAAP